MSWFGHSLVQCPSCLQTRHLPHALSFKGLGVCHRASLEGGQHLGMSCLLPFLPFLGLGLPLLFSVIKGFGGCPEPGPYYLQRQHGPAAVAVITLSCLMCIGSGICPLKSPVPHKSLSRLVNFWRPLLAFSERKWVLIGLLSYC